MPGPTHYEFSAEKIRVKGRHMHAPININCDGLPAGTALVVNGDGSLGVMENCEEATSTKDCQPYAPKHPRDVSLVRCAASEKGGIIAHIGFTMPVDFEKLQTAGQFVESGRVPLYNNHVLWSYAVRLTREEGDSYALSLISCGSHLGREKKTGPLNNDLPGLTAPPEAFAILYLFITPCKQKGFNQLEHVSADSNGEFLFRERPTEQQLRQITAVDGNLNFSLAFGASGEEYFNFGAVIYSYIYHETALNKRKLTLSVAVDRVLCGEKPNGCDWEITGGTICDCCIEDGALPIYSVHKAKFADISPAIKAALDSGESGQTIDLLIGGRRGKLCSFNDHAVRLAIHIAYGGLVPLPNRDAYAEGLIENLHQLFGDHFVKIVIPQWERAICRQALALDKHNTSSSMCELLHLLNLIWSAPYGWMPVAKRIAIGVLADMAHFNVRTSVQEWVKESVNPHVEESCCEMENIGRILDSFYKVMNIVPYVEKLTHAYAKKVAAEEREKEKKEGSEKKEMEKNGGEEVEEEGDEDSSK